MLPAFERKKRLHGLKFGGNKNGNYIILLWSGPVLIQFTTQFRTTRLTTSLQTEAALKKKRFVSFLRILKLVVASYSRIKAVKCSNKTDILVLFQDQTESTTGPNTIHIVVVLSSLQ